MSIVTGQFLSIKAVCLDILCDKDCQATLYGALLLRQKNIEQFKRLFPCNSINRYVQTTIYIALRLIAIKTDNWIIRTTYKKYTHKLLEKYCTNEYLSVHKVKVYRETFNNLTS